MSSAKQLTVWTIVVMALSSGLVLAHSGATGIVKERMDVMSDVGKQMKAIAAIAKGQAAYDTQALKGAAEAIAAHARKIPELFPEGTDDHPSEARDTIWADWDAFAGLAKDLETAAAELAATADAASGPAEVRPFLVTIGATCKGCHEKFRVAR